MIASGKGGTGKTTTTANLSVALALSGHLTVAVDMDMGLRNLDIALGIQDNVVYDICDVIDGNCTIDEALIKHSEYENLYVLSAPQTKKTESFNQEEFLKVLQTLKNRFEFCLIDAPAGMGEGFTYSLEGCDSVIIVAVPENTSLRDADRVISEIDADKEIHLILNRIRPDLIDKGIMMSADDCVDMLSVPIIGIVAEDEAVILLSLAGKLCVSDINTKSGRAFFNIARRLMGETVGIMDFQEKKGFLKRLKQLFIAD